MGLYEATVSWRLADGDDFASNKFSRRHEASFDGGESYVASPSPQVVPEPMSDPAGIDPEEALIASLSSCHMLYFLAFAAKKGFAIEYYVDNAVGEMAKREDGKSWMSKITLRPDVKFVGDKLPTAEEIDDLHHAAHSYCIIGNSLKSEVAIEHQ
ncbi:MAG: OsmC family protein [Novosphingobium sp.]|nr:OsmC family protein [Novosphingobium sp.]